jgi:hypothetical protein
MTAEEAYQAGRVAAQSGAPLADYPLEEPLFRAWLRGFRECQVFDPDCSRCRGSGRMHVRDPEGPYSDATLTCSCNSAPWLRV